MHYRGPDPSSPDAIAGLKARRKRKQEAEVRFQAMSYGLSPEYIKTVTEPAIPERWELEFERMIRERDSNEETLDRYGDL